MKKMRRTKACRPALRPVVPDVNKNLKPLTNKIEPKQLRATEQRGHGWWAAKFKIESPVFPYYYLYALERYESFYESAAGLHIKDPGWYNLGYGFLRPSNFLTAVGIAAPRSKCPTRRSQSCS